LTGLFQEPPQRQDYWLTTVNKTGEGRRFVRTIEKFMLWFMPLSSWQSNKGDKPCTHLRVKNSSREFKIKAPKIKLNNRQWSCELGGVTKGDNPAL
jgi:hypothetical protein